MAAKFLESKDDVGRLLNFVNSWLGHVWEDQAEATAPEKVAALALDYDAKTIPEGALLLTAGVDVQKEMLYYVVRGWGYREESWLIEAGRVERWESLANVLFKTTWRKTQHEHLRVALACIDSGYRTDEVYEFCRPWRDVARPVKGQQRLAGIPIRAVRIERDFAGRAYEGAMQLWHVDTTHMKDKLVRLMSASEPEKSQWHLHRDPAGEYVRHLTAEHKVLVRNKRSGHSSEEWVPRPGAGPHDWLDAEVYAMAAAEMLAVFAMQPEDKDAQPIQPGRGILEQDGRRRRWLEGAPFGRGSGRSWIHGGRVFGR